MRAISLGYHDVASEGPRPEGGGRKSIYTVERTEFLRHMRSIAATAGPARMGAISRRCAWQGLPVFLTFDDGALSAHTCVAGQLEQLGWTGHFFVTTDWIGRAGFLDAAGIRDLSARGHVIGSHSCSHPERMSHLSHRELVREWRESCQVLAGIIGQPVKVASVAGGYYARVVGRAAAACGIEVLFTSEPTTTVSLEDGCLILGRYSIRGSTPASQVAALVAGAEGPRYRQASLWFAKKAAKYVTGPWFPDLRRWILRHIPQS